MENTENVEFKELLTVAKCMALSIARKWQMIVCVVLLCGIVADVTFTLRYTPQYQATARFAAQTEKNTYADMQGTPAYGKTLESILNGQVAQKYVRNAMDAPNMPMRCVLVHESGTNILSIQMISDSRQHAFYGLRETMQWYQEQSEAFQDTRKWAILDQPSFQMSPVQSNSHKKNFIMGAGVSGILVVVFLAMGDFVRKTVRTEKDIERTIGCRLFANLPKEQKPRQKKFWRRNKKAILISSMRTSFAYSEAIKKLRHKLETSAEKHGYKTILITSTSENEGKSSVAANLAIALAMKKKKVLLLDGDLLKPSIHMIFELQDSEQSLNRYLKKNEPWQDQVRYLEKENLYVMTAEAEGRTERLMESPCLRTLLEEAKAIYDYVIVDSAPAGLLNDAIQWNQWVDASLLVIKQDMTGCSLINETIARLSNAKNNLIGCVYNSSVRDRSVRQGRSYGYGQSYQYGRER